MGQASLFCARYDYTPVATSLRVDPGDGVRIVEVGPDTELFRPDANATGKLRDLILFVLNDRAFGTVAMDSHKADGSATIEFDFTLDHDTYATDPYGKRHLILGVHVKVQAVRRTSEVPMTSLTWRGVPAAFGAAKTHLGPTTLTFVEAARGKISAKVLVDGKEVPTYRPSEEGVPGNVRFGPGEQAIAPNGLVGRPCGPASGARRRIAGDTLGVHLSMIWKRYQEETAKFYRDLGCDADVEAKVIGARAEHKVDVWVRFKRFGLETKWVIECKCWNSAVPKEKVLALRSIVDDVGADRGILISSAGFQSGAIRASDNTNITLTDIDELKSMAQYDLESSAVHSLETKAVELKYALHDLYSSEQTSPHSWTSKPLPGVNGKAVIDTIGGLAVLEFGFDRVRLRKPPYPVKFHETGQVVVGTIDEFVESASEVIWDAQAILKSQPDDQTSRGL